MKASRIVIKLDPFCFKQFEPASSSYIPCDKQLFEDKLNELQDSSNLREGYAPFCKHLLIDNFTEATINVLKITHANEELLRTSYEARTEKELPVLRRYFPKDKVELEKAKYLDIILYSKEQIQKETEAMDNENPNNDINYDYAVVSIKPQEEEQENPMDPITMFRNALGKEEGGSGIPLDKDKYLQSVKYWSHHALTR